MDETIACIVEHIQNRSPAQHMAINPAKIMHMLNDPEIAKTVRSCEVITADGMGVVWASRLFKNALPCRVTGIDLMDELLSKSAEIGLKPYFLGAKQDVLEKTVAHYQAKFPMLKFGGSKPPPLMLLPWMRRLPVLWSTFKIEVPLSIWLLIQQKLCTCLMIRRLPKLFEAAKSLRQMEWGWFGPVVFLKMRCPVE